MLLRILKSPYFLAGLGGFALYGATVYQYSSVRVKETGFHMRDPDPTLRIVEKDVLIAKYMKDSARQEKCRKQVVAFNDCVRKTEPNSWARFMTFRTCKPESDLMMRCMNDYFTDENFYYENKARYLRDKAIFQESGVFKKDRKMITDSILSEPEPSFDLKDEKSKEYYDAAKDRYRKTGSIESYDEELVSIHSSKVEAHSSSQVAGAAV